MNELEGLREERDALAAHMGRLRELCEYWIAAAKPGPNPSKQDFNTWLALGYHSRAWADTPETSLARRDAEKQAEALEGVLTCCDKCPPGKSHKDVLRVVDQMARAQRDLIRRQAEGAE